MSIVYCARRALGASVRLLLAVEALAGCARTASVAFETAGSSLTIHRPALYPETIEYDRTRDAFLVSSFREGAIYTVDRRGDATILVNDERLCSVLGIAVDAQRSLLWAVNSDFASSVKPSAAGPKRLAAVGVYDLSTGKPLQYVDLSQLSSGPHLLNGIALDSSGSAYVTDSFSPNIYKIDSHGHAALLLSDPRFAGEGINLNGLVVHPDGYLLVIKKSDGALFKVPLANPAAFTQVAIDTPLIGGDGVLLAGDRNLIVIANQVPGNASNAAFALASDDGWMTARVRATQQLGDVYPTTAVVRDGGLYVIHSKLNELIQSPPEKKGQLQIEATIREIGKVVL
jgi:sugar lactone lactonase YvrE